ncbi:MAG TPA: hypothetical protein ENI80_00905 [Acidiferrobacteraceae bacterium]|nr:hypothetical protein [Acidiferrobacteraceae bacterium]
MRFADNNIPQLLTIAEVVRKHAPQDSADRFCGAVDEYMLGGRRLDECLGLVGTNKHPVQEYRTGERDRYIIEARGHCSTTGEFLREVKIFKTEFWNAKMARRKKPPAMWSEFRQALFHVFKYSGESGVPGRRQIHNIVKSPTGGGCTDDVSDRMPKPCRK